MMDEYNKIVAELEECMKEINESWERRIELKKRYGKRFYKDNLEKILNIEGINKCGLAISFLHDSPRDGEIVLTLVIDDEFLDSLNSYSVKYPIYQTHIFERIRELLGEYPKDNSQDGLIIEPKRFGKQQRHRKIIIEPKDMTEAKRGDEE